MQAPLEYRINPFTGKLDKDTSDVYVGATEPYNPYDGKLWLDTSEEYLEQVATEVTGTYDVLNTDSHLLCDGTFTVTLQLPATRTDILYVTNTGTGVITLSGDWLDGNTSKTLNFQWSTVAILPTTNGYVLG